MGPGSSHAQSHRGIPSSDGSRPGGAETQIGWDAPIRIIHWLNVVAVILLLFSGGMIMYGHLIEMDLRPTKVALKTLHAAVGYLVVANLAFRIVWGFAGPPGARWAALLPGASVRRLFINDLAGLFMRRPGASLARLLMSRVITTAILIIFLTMAATGLFRTGSDLYHPPFGAAFQNFVAAEGVDPSTLKPLDPAGTNPARWRAMMRFTGEVIGRIHRWGAYLLLVLGPLHIAGVIMTDARGRSAVIAPMFTGRRRSASGRGGPGDPAA
jgi:cytochrome b